MARTKYITTTVTQETWEAVTDAANVWGASISKAADRLLQRGLIALDKELGSKTPAYIRLARIEDELKSQESREQRIVTSYERAVRLQNADRLNEIKSLAKELKIDLPKE